jgi:hypothetical protein
MYELQNNLPPSQQDGQGSQRNADYTRYNASPMSQQPQLGMLQSTPYLTDRSGMSQPAPFMSQPQQPSFAPSMGNMGNMGNMGGGMFTGNTGGMNNSFAPQWNQGQQQQQINMNNGPSPISGGVPSQDSGYNNGGLGQVNMTGTGNSYTPQSQQGQQMALPNIDNTQNQGMRRGANMPTGVPQSGTFKPVTFRSGTGTSTSNAGGMTTELNEPYSGLSGLVGAGSGLLGQAAQQSQQAPNQFSYNFNPEQAGQDLFNQRAALLQPQFAQQNAQAQEGMFGSGRLGLRLAGEGIGAGSGMVSPDAFGVNQAQSQALAGLAAQSTNDAFGQQMQRAGLDSNQFAMNQAGQQQQFGNLMGAGQGMFGNQMAQSGLDLSQFNANQMTQQQQYANLMGTGQGMLSGSMMEPEIRNQLIAQQQQQQALDQNYELGLYGNETARITGQAQANQANYQPDPWLSGLTSLGTSFLGSAGGSGWLSDGFSKGGWFS